MFRGRYGRQDYARYHRSVYTNSAEELSERAAEPAGIRDRNVKWLTPQAYHRWVNVGLRGLGPDGRDAVVWRGRNAGRDAAFADLLYHTGLRLQEAGSLLVDELPPIDQERSYYTCRLAAACAKGEAGRDFWMPPVMREVLDLYVGLLGERSRAVARAQRTQRYAQLPQVRLVERVHHRMLRLRQPDGTRQRVSLDVLSPRERRTLYRETERGLEPLALWLNEDGLPRDPHGWENSFQTANNRIRRLGLPQFQHLVCTPHMLRHSFALKWYSTGRLLYERRYGHLTEEETRDFREQFGNVWELVRTLLGHRSIETTMYVYLEPFRVLELEFLLAVGNTNPPDAQTLSTLADLYRRDARILTDPLEHA